MTSFSRGHDPSRVSTEELILFLILQSRKDSIPRVKFEKMLFILAKEVFHQNLEELSFLPSPHGPHPVALDRIIPALMASRQLLVSHDQSLIEDPAKVSPKDSLQEALEVLSLTPFGLSKASEVAGRLPFNLRDDASQRSAALANLGLFGLMSYIDRTWGGNWRMDVRLPRAERLDAPSS